MEPKEVGVEVERLRAEMEAMPVSMARFAAEEQFAAASTAADPSQWALVRAYQALPADAGARLIRGERVLMSGTARGAVPMPEAVRQAVVRGRARLAAQERGTPPPVNPDAPETVEFRLLKRDAVGVLQSSSVPVLLVRAPRYGLQTRSPKLTLPRFILTPSRADHAEPLFRPAGSLRADNPADLNRRITIHWTERKRVPDDPIGFFGGVTIAEVMRYLSEGEPTLKIAGDSPLTPLRAALNAPRNDSARPALSAATRVPNLTLGRFLSEIVSRLPVDIHVRRDGWIVLRSATLYDRADTSVDPEWLKQVFGKVVETSQFPPELAARAATSLTRGQARVLGNEQLSLLPDLIAYGELSRNHSVWRFLGRLSKARRDDFLKGQALRIGGLGPADRQVGLDLLTDLAAEPDGAPYDLELSAENLSAVEVALGMEFRSPDPLAQGAQQSRGIPRNVEIRLARPPLVLLRRFVTCRWD